MPWKITQDPTRSIGKGRYLIRAERDGELLPGIVAEVGKRGDAELIVRAPELAAQVDRLLAENAHLIAALESILSDAENSLDRVGLPSERPILTRQSIADTARTALSDTQDQATRQQGIRSPRRPQAEPEPITAHTGAASS